jgi:hypothetical protein
VQYLKFQLGDTICADGELYQVVGRITYKNTDDNCQWDEYRLISDKDGTEHWLSVDDVYKEYSIWQMIRVPDRSGYHWSDHGTEVVVSCAGDVDVERGDRAEFTEYEDETEEKIISDETWDDGTEHSMGYYLDEHEFWHVRSNPTYRSSSRSGSKLAGSVIAVTVFMLIAVFAFFTVAFSALSGTSIAKYLKKNDNYTYVTSITGNEKNSADVYKAPTGYTIASTATDIINAIDGNTQYVQQDDAETEGAIAILTQKEYCLIYLSLEDEVLVQISDRAYAYTSDDDPYHSRRLSRRYYRSFYYSTGYGSDSSTYSGKYTSPYSSYDGDYIEYSSSNTYHTYSNSVRQASIASRQSSGGGLSGGK